jgi:LuxR family maltose regulon positive regulatory protein
MAVVAPDRQRLLSTKLHRPRVTADLVHRPRLKKLLNDGLDRPLILVAAPAGFGKSTLVSAWLAGNDDRRTMNDEARTAGSSGIPPSSFIVPRFPHAWISLDETDNDLGMFLGYVVAAVQTLFPDALPETQSLLTGMRLPAVGVVARSLLNELDNLGRDFILVLDDYHLIRAQPVHELLGLLLRHAPQALHLVISTRLEPQLPLGVMRARHQVAEIRAQDLRFSTAEIAAFAERAQEAPLAEDALAVLAEKTEGWAAGLRFAILTLRHGGDVDSQLAQLQADNRYVIGYLLSEVLSQLPPAIRSFLLKTAILDQVCGPLGEAVIGPDDPECRPQEFLAWLEQAAMFTVALDARGEWYRYHQLFQELLRDQLARQVRADEIATLHARANAWYARQGALEKALQHALLGNDTSAAVRLLAEQRHALMDSEQWQLHERLLRMFTAETIAEHPDLILMEAWVASLGWSDSARILELLDRAESLLVQMPDRPEPAVRLRGEIDSLRSVVAYEAASDPATVLALARRALATTPSAWYVVRAVAWLRLAAAHQMAGRLDQAYAALAEGQLEDVAQNGAVRARVAGSRCFIEWMAGDLHALPQGAAHMLAVGETYQRRESLGWAHYFLGCAAYQHNDLAAAEAHVRVVEEIRYLGRPLVHLQSAFIDASIHQARGQSGEAQRKIELAFDFLAETRSERLLPLAQAFQAELAVRQGDAGAARHWATTIGPYLPLTAMPFFYAPQLTLPKVLLAQDTPASREQAAAALDRLHAFVTATHNTRFTIEVLALQALLHDAQGDEQAALARLQQALVLAEPGGFIRLFADLGPRLASLLSRLRQTGVLPGYTGQILQACSESAPAAPHPPATAASLGLMELVEPLTDRELEVLALLAQRLTAKEIAQTLVISPLTVKRHASNIYSKLQVNGRREAIAKAASLGLL